MKNNLLIISLLFISQLPFYSQTNMSMKSLYELRTIVTPKVVKEMNERPLLVELLEVNKDVIAKLNKAKKAKKAKRIEKNRLIKESYLNFVNDYNTFIKIAVDKYWELSSEVIYKTTSEINEIDKNKKDYSVLFFYQHIKGNSENTTIQYFNYLYGSSPGLRYSRIEKRDLASTHPDYAFFIPQTNTRQNKVLLSDLIISIKIMQNHLNSILINKEEKNYSFKRFVKKEAAKNCLAFQGKTNLLVKNSDIKEDLVNKHNSKYPKRKLILKNDTEISNLIINENEEIACLFFLFGFPQNDDGGVPTPKYFKSFVDINTGHFFSIYGEKKMQNWKPKLISQDLNVTFKKCK